MLFFFAGYEIDFERIKGPPLRLAALGWALSLALAYGIGGVLAAAGIVLSLLYTGSALATTAIGTLIPILRDAGELRTRFGTYLLGAGRRRRVRADPAHHARALVAEHACTNAAILIVFVALAVRAAVVAVRSIGRPGPRSSERSSRAASSRCGSPSCSSSARRAGRRARPRHPARRLRRRHHHAPRAARAARSWSSSRSSPPSATASSSRSSSSSAGCASTWTRSSRAPARCRSWSCSSGSSSSCAASRRCCSTAGCSTAATAPRSAFFSATQLPLVVAITTIAVDAGDMRTSTAAALVGAAILSTLVFPLVGLRLRSGRVADDLEDLPADDPDALPPGAPLPSPPDAPMPEPAPTRPLASVAGLPRRDEPCRAICAARRARRAGPPDRGLRRALALVGRRPRGLLALDLGATSTSLADGDPYDACSAAARCPGAEWFPGTRLNYAEHVFRGTRRRRRRRSVHASELRALARADLGRAARRRSRAIAAGLRALGRRARATASSPTCRTSPRRSSPSSRPRSLGAIWSSCSPDFGAAQRRRPLRADRAEGAARRRRLPLRRQGLRPARRRRRARRRRCRRSSTPSCSPYLDPRPTSAALRDAIALGRAPRRAATAPSSTFDARAVRPPALGPLLAPARPGLPKAIVHGPRRDPARAPEEAAPAPRRAARRPRLLVHDDRLDDVELPRRRAC